MYSVYLKCSLCGYGSCYYRMSKAKCMVRKVETDVKKMQGSAPSIRKSRHRITFKFTT